MKKYEKRTILVETWLHWFDLMADDNYYYQRPNELDQTMIDFLKPNMKVASIGCGGGVNLFFFADTIGKNGKLYAVDIDPNVEIFILTGMMREYILYKKEYSNIEIIISDPIDPSIDRYTNKKIISNDSLDIVHMEQVHMVDSLMNPRFKISENDIIFVNNFMKKVINLTKKDGIIYIIEGHRFDKPEMITDKVRDYYEKMNCLEIYRNKINKNDIVQAFKKN